MSDSDEDLLALAGAGDEETEEETKPMKDSKKRSRDESSDEDGGMGDDDDDDDDEEMFVNPYPLEGKYKDAKDKAYIEGLPEIEREEILFERGEEMEKYRQKGELARRVRERRQQEKALEKKTKQRSARSTGGKSSQLSELKKRRQEKESRSRRRQEGYDDSDEQASDYDDGEEEGSGEEGSAYGDEEDEERVEWAESKEPKRSLEVNDLNKIRFGKTLLAKYCHYPGFEDAIVGSFVRVNIGYDHETQSNTYRVCVVKGLQETQKPYTFLNRTVDAMLLVAHGRSERAFEMGICSDQPITDKEFDRWKRTMEEQDLSLPSVKKIDRKYKELVELQNHQLTSEEVNEMIKKRQKFSGASVGANAVIEKSMLQQQRVIAMEKGDFAEVEKVDERLDNLERVIQRNQKQTGETEMDKLAKVNERNRRINLERVRRAEAQANENRRKAAAMGNSAADPFSRLRTRSKIFYETNKKPSEPAEQKKEDDKTNDEQQEQTRKKLMAKKKLSRVDDLIANLDIQLEIEV
ncbi:hypothetical protein TRICI_003589 [Trichomonascus ciferrii]|uniref:Plus3 domain-containing protein n=1 Tax=Trichomonascus ciferrii TaxID=44093 RepID=A0A642V2S7_9ASCO|nr:hypothetical protein TRICI_003589 [Trichomonascus ciferrii]